MLYLLAFFSIFVSTRMVDPKKFFFFNVNAKTIAKSFQIQSQVFGNNGSVSGACNLRNDIYNGMEKNEIDSVWREIFFLAHVGHMSKGLTVFEEQNDGFEYENEVGLCNTKPFDGPRFKKRGAGLSILGRCEYQEASDELGIDFVSDPYTAGRVSNGLLVSGWKWKKLGLNTVSDYVYRSRSIEQIKDIFDYTTRVVTGGTMEGREERWGVVEDLFDGMFKTEIENHPQCKGGGVDPEEPLLRRDICCPDPTDPYCGFDFGDDEDDCGDDDDDDED